VGGLPWRRRLLHVGDLQLALGRGAAGSAALRGILEELAPGYQSTWEHRLHRELRSAGVSLRLPGTLINSAAGGFCRWGCLRSAATTEESVMIIDCDRCEMRDIACDDCVVNALLGAPPAVELEDETALALRNLADGGLVPPLRLSLRDVAFG
jgi:hypothetical protein